MTLAADPATLDAASDDLAATAAAVQAVDVAGPFAPVPDALPGSATAEAALWVSTRTAAAVQVLGERLRGTSAGVAGAATDYRVAEENACWRLDGLAVP